MGIFFHKRAWQLQDGDALYSVEASVTHEPISTRLTVAVNGQAQIDGSVGDLKDLWTTYQLHVAGHDVLLRAFKKGWIGVATDFELIVAGEALPEGSYRLAGAPPPPAPAPPAHAPPAPAAAPPRETVREVRTVPTLPQRCPACRAPLVSNEAKWTGPLAAQCPYCDASVPVEWRRLD